MTWPGGGRASTSRTGAVSVCKVLAQVLLLALCLSGSMWGQHGGVAGTVHNLSVSGPGEIRASSETEICKFCHIPHNATGPAPLWSQQVSGANYKMPALRSGLPESALAQEPDGTSRLCLSCHDGTVALGKVGTGPSPIRMSGTQRLGPNRDGYLGTDLTGSHPISFVVTDGVETSADMDLRPLALIRQDSDVKLDPEGKMQCTTCHDPHSDSYYREGRVPRFWVKPTIDEVCLTCHELR